MLSLHTRRLPTTESASLVTFLLISVALIFPPVQLGGTNVGAEDLAALALLPFIFITISLGSRMRWSGTMVAATTIWILIVIHGILFGLLNSHSLLGYYSFPTEMWQYVKRAVYFLAPAYLISYGKLTVRSSMIILLSVLAVTTLIGLIQLGSGSFSNLASSLYARTDSQLENSIGKILNFRRSFGISGFSTSWGGFAAFIAVAALALIFTPVRAAQNLTRKHHALAAVLFVMALINVAFSGSRAAVIALAVGITAMLFAGFWAWRSAIGTLFKMSLILVTVTIGVVFFALDRVAFILFRFAALIESGGGSRTDQIQVGINLLDSWPLWLNGIGNAAQRRLGVSHGIEVEPVFLLVNYGAVGLILRYSLVFLTIVAAVRVGRHCNDIWGRYAGVATVTVAITYMTFSAGYFFFQEPVAGVAPWMFFGICVGAYELMRHAALKAS